MSKNKLVYYFDTAANLEVENHNNGDWVQVTCNWFRSYAGNRRIGGEEYVGPIFYEGTNYLYEGPLNGKIINIDEIDDVKSLKKVRKTTKFSHANEWA